MPGDTQEVDTSSVFQYYWDLASVDRSDREAAAQSLVDTIMQQQSGFKPTHMQTGQLDGNEDIAPDTTRTLQRPVAGCSPMMSYCLHRLIRGLGSGRDAARQGFSTALAYLLQRSPSAPSWEALRMLEQDHLPVNPKLKKSEVRDVLLGRIFYFAALHKGGRLQEQQPAAAAVAALVEVADSKSFLRELATSIITAILSALEEGVVEAVLSTTPTLKAWLAADADSSKPETLMLALHLWDRWPHLVTPTTTPSSQNPAPLCPCPLIPTNCPRLPAGYLAAPREKKLKLFQASAEAVSAARAAMFTPAHVAKQLLPVLRQSSASVPRLHSAWPPLLALLLPSFVIERETESSSTAAGVADEVSGANAAAAMAKATIKEGNMREVTALGQNQQLVEGGYKRSQQGPLAPVGGTAASRAAVHQLWGGVVEGDLLASSSEEKRFTALLLFSLLLPHLDPESVPLIFTPHLLHCLASSLRNSGSNLHAMAKRCVSGLVGAVARQDTDPAARVAIAVAMQRAGGKVLQALQGGKGSQDLLHSLDAECLKLYVQRLQRALVENAAEGSEASPHSAPAAAAIKHREDIEPEEGSQGNSSAWLVEQLYAVMKMPQATDYVKQSALRTLALNAFFEPALGTQGSMPAGLAPSLAPSVRRLCASRLLVAVEYQCKAVAAVQHALAGQSSRAAAAGVAEEPLLQVLAMLSKLRKQKALQPVDAAAAAVLSELEGMDQQLQGGANSPDATQSARVASLLHLLRWLQLYCMADRQAVDPGLLDQLSVLVSVAAAQRRPEPGAQAGNKRDRGSSGNDADANGKGAAKRVRQDEADGQTGAVAAQVVPVRSSDAVAVGDDEEEQEEDAPWQDQLVDVVLSLLSYSGAAASDAVGGGSAGLPSLPLREAVERLFRVYCKELTAVGLQDLLRVLGQEAGSSGQDVLGADAQDDEDDQEDSSMDTDGQTDSSDEDEQEDASEGEVEDSSDREGASEGAREGADSGSDMDDVDMFKMDEKLGAYFRSMQKGGSRDVAAALLQLKLRVVALLEEYAKRASHSPLLPACLPQVLLAFKRTIRDASQEQLGMRLQSLLTQRIFRSAPRALDAAMTGEGYQLLIKRLQYYASRSSGPELKIFASIAWGAFEFAVRAGLRCQLKGQATEACRAALTDFLNKKRSSFTAAAFTSLYHNCPDACLSHLAPLLQCVTDGRNPTVRHHALQLAATLLHQHKAYQHGDLAATVKQVLPQLRAATVAVLAMDVGHGRYADTVKQLCTCLDSLAVIFPGQTPASLLSSSKQEAATLRAVLDSASNRESSAKVEAQLQRLHAVLEHARPQQPDNQPGSKEGVQKGPKEGSKQGPLSSSKSAGAPGSFTVSAADVGVHAKDRTAPAGRAATSSGTDKAARKQQIKTAGTAGARQGGDGQGSTDVTAYKLKKRLRAAEQQHGGTSPSVARSSNEAAQQGSAGRRAAAQGIVDKKQRGKKAAAVVADE